MLKTFLTTTLISWALAASAQSIDIVRIDHLNDSPKVSTAAYKTPDYKAISKTMFKEGNPKYIWMDLLNDGYVKLNDSCSYNLYIDTDKKEEAGNINIPTTARERYAKKWMQFVASLHLKPSISNQY